MVQVLIAFLTLGLAVVSGVIAQCETMACPNLYTSCTNPGTVALTFDDGPYHYLGDIVDQLKDADAKGTFFVNGQNWGCIYSQASRDLLKYAFDEGHLIASHTWNHSDLSNLTYDQVHYEMSRTEEAVRRITGAMVAFMRPPFGSMNDMVYNISVLRGQKVILWDFDPGDSTGLKPNESEKLFDDVVNKYPGPILSLLHETENTTVSEVLPYAITKLKESGYQLVTVAECLNLSSYQGIVGIPEIPNSNWTC